MNFLPAGMTALRVLEGQARLLMSMLPREQLSQIGAALSREPAPGDENALRRDHELRAQFMEKNFERNSPIPTLSDNARAFAESHGLSLPPADGTARQAAGARSANALLDANRQVVDRFTNGPEITALIPSTGMEREAITPAFRELFRQAAQSVDLSGLDVDQLNPRSFTLPLSSAINTLAATAAAEGRTVDRAAMADTLLPTFTAELAALKGVLDSIDALPERQDSDPIAHGRFTAREKTILKEVAQRHDLRDLNALTAVMNQAAKQGTILLKLATLDVTPVQLAETFVELVARHLDASNAIGENKPKGYEDAMQVLIDMGMRLDNITPEQAALIRKNLDSATARAVAGAFNMAYSEFPDLRSNQRERVGAMTAMMKAARAEAGVRSGDNSEVESMFFSGTLDHLREVPGGLNGCMATLASMTQPAISDAAKAMSYHTPPYSLEEWNILLPIAEKISQSGGNAPLAYMLGSLVNAAGRDILAAHRANNGKPLTNAQIWQSIAGFRMPRGVSDANFGARMVTEVGARYQQAVLAAVPEKQIPEIEFNLHAAFFDLQISPRRLLELTRPDASPLTLEEMNRDWSMSSLREYTPGNAYGLCTDFSRRGAGTGDSVMTFVNADGQGFSVHPFKIPHEQNIPTHPAFLRIIDAVRGMSATEVQTARVLQAFSQAGVMETRSISAAFPGARFSEHGESSVTARQREDGAVVVDIASTDPASTVTFKKQYTIATDGSHECTGFEMHRA
jgi:hypothetical protein